MYASECMKCDQLQQANYNTTHAMKNLTQFLDRFMNEGSSLALVVWRAHLDHQVKQILKGSKQVEAQTLTRSNIYVR